MNFNKFIDFKAIPYNAYVDTLVSMSPLPVDGESNAQFYFEGRGLKFIGHFDEVYPGHSSDHQFERFLVLENQDKERLIIFDGATLTRTYSIVCDPNDKAAFEQFLIDIPAEQELFKKEQNEYIERCNRQINGKSLPGELKEYEVSFNLQGKTRLSAVSPAEAESLVNERINQHYVYPRTDFYVRFPHDEYGIVVRDLFDKLS